MTARTEAPGTVTDMSDTAVKEPAAVEVVETSVAFFQLAAKRMASEARRVGWGAAEFVALPKESEHPRTVGYRNGRAVVSVKLSGRVAGVVLNDMVDGVVHANTVLDPRQIRLGYSTDDVRAELWRCGAGL
jgi:hypothetical protein